MVGKVRGLDPNKGGVRQKGTLRVFYSQKYQRWIAQRWPKRQRQRAPGQVQAAADFAQAVQLIKFAVPEDVQAATDLTRNTAWLVRDSLMSNVFGNSIFGITTTGELWQGVRVSYTEIQTLLNALTNIEGSIIMFSGGQWIGFNPNGTTAGQVLTSNGPGVAPDYQDIPPEGIQSITGGNGVDASTVSFATTIGLASIAAHKVLANIGGTSAVPSAHSIQELLDLVSSTTGAVLYHDGATWVALAPSADGDVLTLASGVPTWAAVSGGGGYTPGTVPSVVQSGMSNAASASITLSAAPTNGNMLVCMFFNPVTPNVAAGWTQRLVNTTGTDYGVIATKIAGAGESATQTPISGFSGTAGLICMWELHGQAASDRILAMATQAEQSGILNTPVQFANVVGCIGLSAVSVVTGVNIDKYAGFGTVDQSILNSGNRRGVMGHSDLSSAPVVGGLVRMSGTGNTKGATILITS